MWPWIVGGILLLAVMPFAIKMLGGGAYYAEEKPGAMVARAEQQLANGEFSAARDTYELAMLRKPDGETATRLADLKTRLDAQQHRAEDQGALDSAQKSVQAMRDLQNQYPLGKRPSPVVRELARTSKSWLDRYSAVAKRHPDTAPLVTEVQVVHDAHRAQAQLDRPDNAEDVLFAVERRLGVANPQWSEALRQLDDYVSSHPHDSAIDTLKSRRKTVVEAAQAAFDKHEASAKNFLAERKFDDARKQVTSMRSASVVPGLDSRANELEQQIARAAR